LWNLVDTSAKFLPGLVDEASGIMKSKNPFRSLPGLRIGTFSRFQPGAGDFFKKKPVFDSEELTKKRVRVLEARARHSTKEKEN